MELLIFYKFSVQLVTLLASGEEDGIVVSLQIICTVIEQVSGPLQQPHYAIHQDRIHSCLQFIFLESFKIFLLSLN